MIKIMYKPSMHRVTAKGHAGAGEKGSDIVCAAVSVLLYTLAENVENVYHGCETEKTADGLKLCIKLADGDGEISIGKLANGDELLTLQFETICTGFEMLARRYPKNVEFVVA